MVTSELFPHQTIMVADPEELFRRITVSTLSQLGCRILETASLRESRDLLRRQPPDAILTEAVFPEGEIPSLLSELTSSQGLQDVPILIVTTERNYEMRLACFQAGAVDYIIKPFAKAELCARVATHLRLRLLHARMLAWQETLKEQEKIAFLRTFALGVAHNFNNLLTSALGFLGLCLGEVEDRSVLSHLRNMELTLRRMSLLSRQLLATTEGYVEGRREVVSVREAVRQALALFDASALRSHATVICDFTRIGDACVVCESFELIQSLLKVLHNAREAVAKQGGGRILFTAFRQDPYAVIEIRDFGPGMSEAMLARLRQPFFTTKQEVGVGLSLAMVHRFVEDLGGRLEILSAPGEGTTVRFFLPLGSAPTAPRPTSPTRLRPGLRALLAVDAEETLAALQATLVAARVRIETATTLRQLESLLTAPTARYDLLILDLLRAAAFGDELVAAIRTLSSLPILYLASTPREAPTPSADLVVLPKPFSGEELLRAIQSFPSLVTPVANSSEERP